MDALYTSDHDRPLLFARNAKRWLDSREDKLLWNIVDKRNTAHLKLLKFLGFKFLRELKHGPNQLTFIEFCRVRTNYTCPSLNGAENGRSISTT